MAEVGGRDHDGLVAGEAAVAAERDEALDLLV
jgi:hypothetical protein